MPAQVTLLHGPPRSGKSGEVRSLYLDQVRNHGFESALFILPSVLRVREEKRALCEALGGAAVTDPVVTFPELAARILLASDQYVTRITPPLERLVVAASIRHVADATGSAYLRQAGQMPGFIGAVRSLIIEFKRAALRDADAPRLFAQAGLQDPRTRELLGIYSVYQRILKEERLFDDEGAFWWALEIIKQGRLGPLGRTRLVLVDGFTDFTPIQLELLGALSRSASGLVITLTDGPAAADTVSALWNKGVAVLQERFPDARRQSLEKRGEDPLDAQLRHVVNELFAPQKQKQPLGSGSIQLICAPGDVRQVEEAARICKRLIVAEGFSPSQIGVVFRDPTGFPGVMSVFETFGVPVECGSGGLAQCPAVNTALKLLEMLLNDFQRADVVSFLRSGYVDSAIPGARGAPDLDALDALSRRAGVVGGREQWLARLERVRLHCETLRAPRGAPQAASGQDERGPHGAPGLSAAEIRDTISYMHCFFALFDAVPAEGTLDQFVSTYQQLLDSFRIGERLVQASMLRASARDMQGYTQLLHLLKDLSATAAFLPSPAVSLKQFHADLVEGVQLTPMPTAGGRSGGVRILDALQARQLHFRALFLMGLNEGNFPRCQREALFFHDKDRERLQRQGVPLPTREMRGLLEARLFYEMLSRAGERVYLVFSSFDAQGREILRSHYVDEVIEAFESPVEQRNIARSDLVPELARACHPLEAMEASLAHLSASGPACASMRAPGPELAWLLNAGARAGDGTPWESILRHAVQTGVIERGRYEATPADSHDGRLGAVAAGKHLRKLFGPDRVYSASQIEQYASCPFAFFCKRVLKVAPLEDPAHEMDPMLRGTIYHEILRRFLSEPGAGPERAAGQGALPGLHSVVDSVFASYEQAGLGSHKGIWDAERRRCRSDMKAWLACEEALREKGHVPHLLEIPFGPGQALCPELSWKKEKIKIRGRVDRVDLVGDDGFALYDYKTAGAPDKKEQELGRALQLPFYHLAVSKHPDLEGRSCKKWAYYVVRKRPIGEKASEIDVQSHEHLEEHLARTRMAVASRIASMRAGRFTPAWWGPCRYCEYGAVCRHDRERLLNRHRATSPVPHGPGPEGNFVEQ